MFKLAHTADLHLRRDRMEEGLASLAALETSCREEAVSLIVIAGDIWDAPIQNTTAFPRFVEAIRRLADIAAVAMIYGTPSHDVEGSLDVFETLEAAHGVTVLRPGNAYYLSGVDGRIHAGKEAVIAGISPRAIVFGVPEPSKKWLLAEAGAVGKDAADEAARGAIKNLLLGLGGMRREHPEIPCVLLYHGQVAGAKTGTGYTAGSALAVSRDELAAVGADYIALGDIHEPQQIDGLPAYYPGSSYPLNWGETHQAGWNLVTFEIGENTVERRDYPHPVNWKWQTKAGGGWMVPTGLSCSRVWWEITCTKEEAAGIDVDHLLEEIVHEGALPGSRVTLNILPTETVRAGEIAEKKSLREKLIVWAENSGREAPESVLKKADAVEETAARSGHSAGKGGAIRLTKLTLRGAIGIWKNQRKDEVVLDFSSYGTGVIALVGENGSGKTTLIENCHPWPCMLTRDGTLKDHFRLRDSVRELHFTDEVTGDQYKALIQINAATASGGAEYYLYKNGQPLPGINGRKEPYEQAVAEIFGSLPLYLKSAFTSQRPSKYSPDFSDATKGQRKDLMAELSGIDYLAAYADIAKGKADEAARKIADLTVEAQTLERLVADIPAREAELTAAKNTLAGKHAEAAEIEAQVAEAEETEKRAADEAAKQKDLEARAGDAAKKIVSLDQEAAAIGRMKEELSALIAGKPGIIARIARYETLREKEARLNAEKTRVLEERDRITREYRNTTEAFRNEEHRLNAEKLDAEKALSHARQTAAVLQEKLTVVKAELAQPLNELCPTCGQTLPPLTLKALTEKREETQAKKARLEAEKAAVDADVLKMSGKVNGISLQIADLPKPPDPVLPEFDGAELAATVREAAGIDSAALRENLRRAEDAAVRIEEGGKRLAAVEAERAEVFSAYLVLKGKIDPAVLTAAERAKAQLEELRRRRMEIEKTVSALSSDAVRLSQMLAELSDRAAEIEKVKAEVAAETVESADWRMVQDACGQNGIQALELDALCPGIAAVANELLAAAYGPRYQIEFSTTRIGGKGSKTKQIEDFLIYIIDAETGMQQEISTLSGGESVWIKRAIYDAFAIIRGRNTGIRFLTNFQDESDGALDPAAREMYFRMLEAAHVSAGRHQSIIITHSREVQDMIGQKIDVSELAARTAEEPVA